MSAIAEEVIIVAGAVSNVLSLSEYVSCSNSDQGVLFDINWPQDYDGSEYNTLLGVPNWRCSDQQYN